MKLLDTVLTFLDRSPIAEWELVVIATAVCGVALLVAAFGAVVLLR